MGLSLNSPVYFVSLCVCVRICLCLYVCVCLYSTIVETAATYSATSVHRRRLKWRRQRTQFAFVTLVTRSSVEDDEVDDAVE